MLRNYFVVALRNILKHKFYSFINILGLTIGITATIFVVIYIVDELSFDRFNTNIDNIYRVGIHGKLGGQDIRAFDSPPVMAAAIVDEVPEINAACRIWDWEKVVLRYQDVSFTEDKIYNVDSNFFQFFTFTLLKGNPETALKEPNSIVLTQNTARKYFGDSTAVGKLMTMGNDKKTYKVTGIVANPPSNSQIKFNCLVSINSNEFIRKSTEWLNNNLKTYFSVYPGSDIEKVKKEFAELVVKHVGPELQQFMGISLEQFIAQQGAYGYIIEPMKDVHLHGNLQDELEPPGNITYLYILGAIGIFLLLIATINFMNLSTARSSGRTKEVGLRKTFGSYRWELIVQFLSESVIFAALATFLSILLVMLFIPQFNLISGKEIALSTLLNWHAALVMMLLIFMVGVLAGSYPAFFLTKFRVTEVLKGTIAKGMKGGKVRGILVVVQFMISIFLIISTVIVYRQLMYTQSKNLGFNKEQVMVLSNTSQLDKNRQPFKDALTQYSGIDAASYSNSVIPSITNTTIFRKEGADEDHIISEYWADYDHVDAMQFHIAAGRNFSRDFPSDSSAILVNEATVKEMGWDNGVNEYLISFEGNGKSTKLKVVGVLKDFNYASLRETIRPLIIRLGLDGDRMAIRFNSDNPREVVSFIKEKWQTFAPNAPFEYAFLDQTFDAMYRTEQRLSVLFTIFTGIAIFIACLGLFGLAAYTTEQKTKEIGIRKAMGATGFNIVSLLSKEFIRFVLIAFILAVVPAYFFVDHWLGGFVYRINIEYGIFVLSGMAALIIALLTVSYQSLKAARINPSETLRYE